MADLADGLIIDHSNVNSNNLTYRGKPVKFQKDENSNIYRADVKFNEEEKAQGKQDAVLTYSPNFPTGTVAVVQALPDDEDFKDLTDAEKFTKLNSLSYQTGTPEATQIADGSQATHIGIQANANKEADHPANTTNWHMSKTRENARKAQLKQQQKQEKESATTTTSTTSTAVEESGPKAKKTSEK